MGIAVFIRILWAGFLWLTSAGNASKAGQAKSMITNAVVGAILLFAAYLILYIINPDLVKNTFNFNLPISQQTSIQPLTQTTPTDGSAALAGVIRGRRSASSAIPSAYAQEGIYFFTIRVVDANGDYYDQDYTMEVLDNYALDSRQSNKVALPGRAFYNPKVARAAEDGGGVLITTAFIPDAVIDQPYFAEIIAAGGRAPYAYSIVDGSSSFLPINQAMAAGSLPDGISLHSVADMPILTIQNKTAQRTPSYAFNQTDRFLLEVTNARPNSDLYFKWIKNSNPWYYPGKTPDQFGWTKYGVTDSQGKWTNEANFTSEQVGLWIEYVLVVGAISRPINFQVVATQVAITTSTPAPSGSSAGSSGPTYVFTPCVADTFCEDPATGERSAIKTDAEIAAASAAGTSSNPSDRCPNLRQTSTCSYPAEAGQRDCSGLQFEWRNCQQELGSLTRADGTTDLSGLPDSPTSDPKDAAANPGELFTADGTPRVVYDAAGKPLPQTLTIEKVGFCKYSNQTLAINCGMPKSGEYCSVIPFRGPNTGATVPYCAPVLP